MDLSDEAIRQMLDEVDKEEQLTPPRRDMRLPKKEPVCPVCGHKFATEIKGIRIKEVG